MQRAGEAGMEEKTMWYDEALQEIKQAREAGATKLNLMGLELTEVPPEVFELTDLVDLDLSCNRLIGLPSYLLKLVN